MGVRRQYEPPWTDFVGEEWHHYLMDAELVDRLHQKQGRSIARWTLRRGSSEWPVFVKRHFSHAGWRTWLARVWRRSGWSDAGREWRNLQRARELGLAVPRPVAMAEWNGSELRSVLVVEELTGMLALHEAIPLAAKLLTPERFRDWKRALIVEMVGMVRLLHDRGYFHRDLYLCHFFVRHEDLEKVPSSWRGRVFLIDFHRLSRQRILPFLGRMKDLAQLLYSARVDGVDLTDVQEFWRLYGGSRLLGCAVRLKARHYARHNLQGKVK
jgi:Lipopolysaccharide kinase (Kdo/WaaP) family